MEETSTSMEVDTGFGFLGSSAGIFNTYADLASSLISLAGTVSERAVSKFPSMFEDLSVS